MNQTTLSQLAGCSISELQQSEKFVNRHLGPDNSEQVAMLNTLGMASLTELLEKVVPTSIRRQQPMALAQGLTEHQSLEKLKSIASKNKVLKSFIGMGYYNTLTPPTIQRNILENPAWYTAYTPYQAEISQGRLEAMLNFQTMVSDLTGLELANASMLDEATACAEAMTLCQRMSKSKGKVFFVAEDCHPQNIEVVQTRAEPLGIEVVVGNPLDGFDDYDLFGVLLQYPGTYGEVTDFSSLIEQAHAKKALVTMSADLLALTLLKTPGEMGADVAVGNTQRFGVPLGYGGPHAAYMATKDNFKRSMPGRLIGVSLDSRGKKAYRLALQTREQHIRREKATSNICTAQALLAVMASMYAVYHGAEGLTKIAYRVHRYTQVFATGLGELGIEIGNKVYFDTLTISVPGKAQEIHSLAVNQGYNLRPIDADHIGVSFDESTTVSDLETLWKIFGGEEADKLNADALVQQQGEVIQGELARTSGFLTHPVFHEHRSETEMMRYMRHLADKDLALDRAMIPLGSCTMKLNATAELMPVSWPEFANIHPFVPLDQAQGYQQMVTELEKMLCETTGYDAVSLQPNSGAQGEYAGLLAIRAYHKSRNEAHRDVCLIPASAHGTNPASAQMVGMKVVVVKTNAKGEIDLDDLQSKLEKHSVNLAAIMITYPSTHGVFEQNVKTVCDLVHQHGGQVYIDGANMNAMVGVAAPGHFGGDVSHLNLHKTFAIPHGGGGPGVGPIGVGKHLAPFLPGYAVVNAENEPKQVGAVSAAPWGSAGVLPISWSYIAMMGRDGLIEATATAILNANYIAQRLAPHYPILYSDDNGLVAHECIIDLRPIKEESGISVDDIAKRLIDYGFHAPTMSFPVAGTLMIEPTESESKVELDRFCDAMLAIKEEINDVMNGALDENDNPLKNAPHTADSVMASDWPHGYSRELAAYPVDSLRDVKYWCPVGRVDNVYGDRNLVCSCPPLSDYSEEGEA
ncbi:aminomethyl-transferring glycine dehydrogenase [Thiomicrorhabdus lithotrophica]|uniref:Glycine dehydrogenase (decarboxylating) n=1 Tax=Thiomicrorhabdus lithotrophica TaxID=2949997 RepID=A0ABY8CBQ3_9GAMM|nr:aminomethyl-transferring glycine dehydrogenase [Thiomicrorhabdus lithotrophica]WEJ63416.1 aminomethyl-transferring glycine dehydrogenase [Thiomicrorhabdus lithotrophica]